MDDIVRQALLKWPDVPDCRGWLHLTRRGAWRVPTGIIHHAGLSAFIGRNYGADETGRWFFQNGPQKVFVSLEYTPYVLRLRSDGSLETHTGLPVDALQAGWLDDDGSLLLDSEHGIGLLDDRDLAAMAEGLEGNPDSAEPLHLRWRDTRVSIGRLKRAEVSARFGFLAEPT
ncbi:MAG TPA: DUF2946 family protein [Zoogloea sp.]|uniref:DUF2946 family protein n=1 Tax=Zoogloea sp. TaxID=49181 RepID=UPI002C16A533|nr:DUF2946 family protein [Zoogloea sp.]HMV17267.1 DUF2946 family protein [Rhodocyclaceae bacterium]HMV63379.1 DUF2946 family protein [Rhodocyclaceae bacterium]HMW51215.1 DUF2946 family protein [Rhodocyclaceae bacterium]HMY50009.1 DUF2946 family protein [Rhodocyclaceae bacterium]HMZ76380.1 DUF2946 family protein [Rhodocyclaceae bacterium]